MKIIELRNKKGEVVGETIVDDEDYERLTKIKKDKIRKWHLDKDSYVIGYIDAKTVRMHRYLINAQKGEIVDHIDRNPLNNSKSNLRIVTSQQNAQNRSKINNSSSIYKGVKYYNSKYKSFIIFNGIQKTFGTFKSEIAAAYAYNKEVIKISEYFPLNKFDLTIEQLEEIYIRDKLKKNVAELQSKYEGVYWHINRKKWSIYVRICGKQEYFGLFKTEEEAYQRLLEVKKEHNIK
jgi:hypothetical protein